MSEALEAMTDQPTPAEAREAAPGQALGPTEASGGALDRMFDVIDQFGANAVFGRPEQVGGQTVIPVASVWYGFGFGRGGEHHEGEPHHAEGAGGGGGGRVTPVALVVVEGDRVRVEPVINVTRIVTTALVLFGLVRLIRSFR